jgi:hypothetical protein
MDSRRSWNVVVMNFQILKFGTCNLLFIQFIVEASQAQGPPPVPMPRRRPAHFAVQATAA